jgi:hypothetical protein
MISAIYQVMEKLPPLNARKSPNLACLLGLVAGGIALGIYFRSFVDFIIPIGIALAITVVVGSAAAAEVGWVGGAVLAAVYGYFRAQNSNERLERAPVRTGLETSLG